MAVNLITLGIGPGSAIKYLLTGGLDLGEAAPAPQTSGGRQRRRGRVFVPVIQEIEGPQPFEVVEPPPLETVTILSEAGRAALELRAEALERRIVIAQETALIAQETAQITRDIARMEDEARRIKRRLRDEADILAILALVD